jgi:uncharacterized alkaline shock family protein YloU
MVAFSDIQRKVQDEIANVVGKLKSLKVSQVTITVFLLIRQWATVNNQIYSQFFDGI